GSSLYTYTLTIKEPNSESTRTQRGHVILNRAGSATDQVWVTSDSAVSVGAEGRLSRLTVVGSGEATVGGAQMPGESGRPSAPNARGSQERQTQERVVEGKHQDSPQSEGKKERPQSPSFGGPADIMVNDLQFTDRGTNI